MKITGKEMEVKAIEALKTSLQQIPFLKGIHIQKPAGNAVNRPDILAKVQLPKEKQNLVIVLKNNGQPRYARQAVNSIARLRQTYPGGYGIFIAPYISLQAAQICKQEGIGYLDLAGNCYITFRHIYIAREGFPNSFAIRRDFRSLYSPKATRITRTLLCNSPKKWKMQDLAKAAGVSLGQVFNVKKLLLDREWIASGIGGFKLDKPELLLQEWSKNYNFRRNITRDFYSLKNVPEIESRLAELCKTKGLNYAFTGFSGAARLAPAVRYQRVMAYVEEINEELISLLELKEIESGANVTLLIPYDNGVFYGTKELEEMRIASPTQIYLDLIGFKGRGEEAATKLLEKVIRPSW